jgi:hypothetical protein
MTGLPGATGQILRFRDIPSRDPHPMGVAVPSGEDDVCVVMVDTHESR